MDNITIKAIGKYALILVICYGIELLFSHSSRFLMDESSSGYIPKVLSVLPIVFTFVLNIVVAIIINMDKSKLGIEGKYSVLLTIFYRPIGVVVFLIYLINKEFSRKASL